MHQLNCLLTEQQFAQLKAVVDLCRHAVILELHCILQHENMYMLAVDQVELHYEKL